MGHQLVALVNLVAPHFDFPFRFTGTTFAQNEQDSIDDIVACVRSVLVTQPGERQMLPDFGMPDPSFSTQGHSAMEIATAVMTWEPRAATAATEEPQLFLTLIGQVDLTAHGSEA